MFVVQAIVQQVSAYVLAIVTPVLVLVQYLIVQQMLLYVLVTVISVLVLARHIAVWQMPVYAPRFARERVLVRTLVIIVHLLIQIGGLTPMVVQEVKIGVLMGYADRVGAIYIAIIVMVAQCKVIRHVGIP